MDVEKIATSSIENILSKNDFLKTDINNNDKIPIWDGGIFVYNKPNKNKPNKDLRGKAPIQIKGKSVKNIEEINSDKIRFPVRVEDLKQYSTDGGTIYFVVLINKKNSKIYYNSLLPFDIERLLKNKKENKTINIEFETFPDDKIEQADIFLNFIENKKSQLGTLLSDFLSLRDIKKKISEVKEFVIKCDTIDSNKFTLFKNISKSCYIYAKTKGLGNPIPVEKITDTVINIKTNFQVSINGVIYFDNAPIEWRNGIPSLICGNSIRIPFPYKEDSPFTPHKENIKIEGTLNERINLYSFIFALEKYKKININNKIVNVEISLDNYSDLLNDFNLLKKIKRMLKKYNIDKDLNIDLLSEKDWITLSFLLEEKPTIKKYKLENVFANLYKIKILDIHLLLLIKKEKTYYNIKDFYSVIETCELEDKKTQKKVPVSQYVMLLKKEDLICDNLNVKKIIEDIKRKENMLNLEYANQFLLETICTYDSNSSNKKLCTLIEKLSKYIHDKVQKDYSFLNYLQVKYRLKKLTKKDIKDLNVMKKKYKDDLEMLAGILILLNEKKEVKNIINKMDKKTRKTFQEYPIYNLISN